VSGSGAASGPPAAREPRAASGSRAASDPRPVLFVTGHAPPSRLGPFVALHDREEVVFALFGGRAIHAMEDAADLPFPHLRPSQRAIGRLAASGRFRAVVCGTGGRVALPAAYAGARRARVPFVLWASLWAHPRSLAGAAGYLPLRHVYRHADALVTYGPHVSAYVRAKGARRVVEAPQTVDNEFWSNEAAPIRRASFQIGFVGRRSREKGLQVLLSAWRASGLAAPHAALVLVGDGPDRSRAVATSAVLPTDGVVWAGEQSATALRNFYAGSDVVVIPSVPTSTIRETWSLVANEAMNQGVPVIASDAVGAAAGGLVRHERTGLVVPAGDPVALAGAICRLRDDTVLRRRLGAGAREAVRAYTADAWAAGFSRALGTAGVGRGGLVA
jgi:glycosyltransferase involved in cell wall biosynthesis